MNSWTQHVFYIVHRFRFYQNRMFPSSGLFIVRRSPWKQLALESIVAAGTVLEIPLLMEHTAAEEVTHLRLAHDSIQLSKI
jgi:hypothetical protein